MLFNKSFPLFIGVQYKEHVREEGNSLASD